MTIVPRTLAGRMIVAFVGVVVLAMLALVITVPGLARERQLAALEDRLASEAQLLGDYVATEMGQAPGADLDALAKRLGQRSDTRLTIIAPDGQVLGESHQDLSQVGNHANRSEVQAALAGRRGIDVHHSETVGYDMLYVAVPIIRNGTVVDVSRAALPLSEIDRLVADQTRAILMGSLLGMLLALGASVLAARAIAEPLRRLTGLARELAENPLRAVGPPRRRGPLEVVELDDGLRQLAGAIKLSIRAMGEERDRLDAVLANLADGIVMFDRNGVVERLNPAAEKLLAADAPLIGRSFAEALRDHELIALVEQVIASAAATPMGATAILEQQHPRRLLRGTVHTFAVFDETKILLQLQDLTDLRRLETVRRDFIANVSHELRTPISSIRVMTETLQDGAVDDPEAARDFLGRIMQELDGVHQLVEELLELARSESRHADLSLAATDPADLVQNVVDRLAPLAERANVSLTGKLPPLPVIMVDRERIGQTLANVIHNAIKFTPPGGRVAVWGTVAPEAVILSVADSGIGIEPEILTRIFERFYKADRSRSGRGTGLGLAIARHTIELHGGRIWAESAGTGRGTTIHIQVPVKR